MHELSIAEAILEQITERLGEAPVTVVRLRVGELSGVVPDALRFCWDLAAEGSVLAGAALTIDEIAADCACRTCGSRFHPADGLLLCGCGSADVEVRAGTELMIAAVEVRDRV